MSSASSLLPFVVVGLMSCVGIATGYRAGHRTGYREGFDRCFNISAPFIAPTCTTESIRDWLKQLDHAADTDN